MNYFYMIYSFIYLFLFIKETKILRKEIENLEEKIAELKETKDASEMELEKGTCKNLRISPKYFFFFEILFIQNTVFKIPYSCKIRIRFFF